jgi:hypothetical protein
LLSSQSAVEVPKWVEVMWSGRRGFFTFGLGVRPFGFYFWGPGGFPRRERYLRLLEEYRDALREELAEVEKEIEEIGKGSTAET